MGNGYDQPQELLQYTTTGTGTTKPTDTNVPDEATGRNKGHGGDKKVPVANAGAGDAGRERYLEWHRAQRGGRYTTGPKGQMTYTDGEFKGQQRGEADAAAMEEWQTNAELRAKWAPKGEGEEAFKARLDKEARRAKKIANVARRQARRDFEQQHGKLKKGESFDDARRRIEAKRAAEAAEKVKELGDPPATGDWRTDPTLPHPMAPDIPRVAPRATPATPDPPRRGTLTPEDKPPPERDPSTTSLPARTTPPVARATPAGGLGNPPTVNIGVRPGVLSKPGVTGRRGIPVRKPTMPSTIKARYKRTLS